MHTSKRKAVVTGGAGFIGSHLSRALLDEQFDVSVVDTLVSGARERVPEGARLHEIDVRDTSALENIFSGAQFVFHLAALPRVQYSIEHPEETSEVNTGGTLSVLKAAAAARVARVIYSASSAAYGDATQTPLREDLPVHPKSPYGLQKYIGELYCRLWSDIYGLSTVSLRYFNVYGPGANAEGAYALVVANFLAQHMKREPLTITGDGSQTRDFIHVRDVVRANILAARSTRVGRGEVLNIGAGKNASINEIAALFGDPILYVPARFEPHDTLADNSRARTLLGWRPETELERGIAELKASAGVV